MQPSLMDASEIGLSSTSAKGRIERTPVHKRQVTYEVWARFDGFFDVEGTLVDTKGIRFERLALPTIEPGQPVHHMTVCLTLDEHLGITAAKSDMHAVPVTECREAQDPLQLLVGAQIGRGWRRIVDEAMGGTAGCTHMRELVYNLATAAFQGVPSYRDLQRREKGLPAPHTEADPFFIGGCRTWRKDGPVVQRLLPQYAAAVERSDRTTKS